MHCSSYWIAFWEWGNKAVEISPKIWLSTQTFSDLSAFPQINPKVNLCLRRGPRRIVLVWNVDQGCIMAADWAEVRPPSRSLSQGGRCQPSSMSQSARKRHAETLHHSRKTQSRDFYITTALNARAVICAAALKGAVIPGGKQSEMALLPESFKTLAAKSNLQVIPALFTEADV